MVSDISLQWFDEIRYLGVHIIRSSRFKISVDRSKRSFYRVANSIFGRVGRVASEEVTIQLFNTKCVPILQLQLQSFTLQQIVLRGIMQCCRLVGTDEFSALIGTVGD